jgi:hypothetical protein
MPKILILIGMLDGAPDEANWICRDSSASAGASLKRLLFGYANLPDANDYKNLARRLLQTLIR